MQGVVVAVAVQVVVDPAMLELDPVGLVAAAHRLDAAVEVAVVAGFLLRVVVVLDQS